MSTRALFASVLLAAVLFARAPINSALAEERGADPASRAFVEVTSETPLDQTIFVAQTIRLRVRIGYDEAWFAASSVPLFQQRLDPPIHIDVPWIRALSGATIDVPPAASDASVAPSITVAVNDGLTKATRAGEVDRHGRRYRVVEFERLLRVARGGDLVLTAPNLRFAYGTEFDDDFLRGRVPRVRHDVTITGTSTTLHVSTLPAEGRPPGFTGAVGRFTISATTPGVDPVSHVFDVGETIRFALQIHAEGDVGAFDPPQLDDLDGFHVQGRTDDHGAPVRTVTYELIPLHTELLAISGARFAYFDPTPPAGYRVAKADPLSLRMRPPWAAQPDASVPPPAADATSTTLVVTALICAALLAGFVLARRRRKNAAVVDSAYERLKLGAAGVRACVAEGRDGDLAKAFAQFLAARLRCPEAAVIGPDLARRLVSAGVEPNLAGRAAEQLKALTGARYGAAPDPAAPAATLALTEQLHISGATQPQS